MKYHLQPGARRLRALLPPLGALGLTALLSAARLDGYAPFALGLTAAAESQLMGLGCVLGAAAGALVFLPFQAGLRHLAAAILIFSAQVCFADTERGKKPGFRVAAAVVATALVQAVCLVRQPLYHTAAFLVSLLWQGGITWFLLHWKKEESLRPLALTLGFALALSVMNVTVKGWSLGRTLLPVVLLTACRELTAPKGAALGLLAGLTAELTGPKPQALYAVLCGTGCAMASFWPQQRMLSILGFLIAAAVIPVLFGAETPLLLLGEAGGGAVLFRFLPQRWQGRRVASEKRTPPPEKQRPEETGWQKSGAAFRELYDSFFRETAPLPPENPSVIFDQAAEQVCRNCVLRHHCWQENYNATYSAFNDACPQILRRGHAEAGDFPIYFTARCVHLSDFTRAVSGEVRTYLLRRQYHQRLQETRRQARQQYAQLGDLLSGGVVETAAPCTPLGYQIGSALRPKEGERLCGDQLAVFEVGQMLYLLISDGMGSGESAHREAAMTVRLLRQFLSAGIEPAPALKTLNGALALRGEDGGGFTTIDLLAVQRTTGNAVLYKYGAAPSYLKRSGTVSRFTAASLPAGLQQGDRPPERTRLSLPGDSYFVMVSDGIADANDDEWLQNLLAGWSGGPANELTSRILDESRSRRGLADDCAVLVVHLPAPGGPTAV